MPKPLTWFRGNRPVFGDTDPATVPLESPEGRQLARQMAQLETRQDHTEQELPDVVRAEVLRQFGRQLVLPAQREWIEAGMRAGRQDGPPTLLDECARWAAGALTLVSGIAIGMGIAAWHCSGA